MGLTRRIVLGSLLMLFLLSCSSFAFKYYPLDYDNLELVGDKPEHDLPLITCKGDDQVKRKCIVMFIDEFERMRAHQIDVEKRLEACESPH